MNLREFRANYPQYNDMDDHTLVTKLHQKHYSDMDFGEFAKRIQYGTFGEEGRHERLMLEGRGPAQGITERTARKVLSMGGQIRPGLERVGTPYIPGMLTEAQSARPPMPLQPAHSFDQWYSEQAQKYGLDPNPDDPRHFYDWKAAYQAGAQADETGHWPSEFKKIGHPNLIVEGNMDSRTGQPFVPETLAPAHEPYKEPAPLPPVADIGQVPKDVLKLLGMAPTGIGYLGGLTEIGPETEGMTLEERHARGMEHAERAAEPIIRAEQAMGTAMAPAGEPTGMDVAFEQLMKVGDVAGAKVLKETGNPYLAAGAATLIQASPILLPFLGKRAPRNAYSGKPYFTSVFRQKSARPYPAHKGFRSLSPDDNQRTWPCVADP
jgi:hypothetical protein